MAKMEVPRMRIPVFVSSPSPDNLSLDQEASAKIIHDMLLRYKLEWRALGRSDYPNDLPLKEVLRMVRHCSGGIILGFEQFRFPSGEYKRGSPNAKQVNLEIVAPTPWNHLEAGILFSSNLPMMIFSEPGITGGVFDAGATEVFVHRMPTPAMTPSVLDDLDSVFQNWVARVRRHYYGE